MADQFCDGMLVFRVKAHRVDERFLDLVEEGKGSFVVADDELVLLSFKPSTAGGDFFIYSRVSRGVRIAARNFPAILWVFDVDATAVPDQDLAVCVN